MNFIHFLNQFLLACALMIVAVAANPPYTRPYYPAQKAPEYQAPESDYPAPEYKAAEPKPAAYSPPEYHVKWNSILSSYCLLNLIVFNLKK